MANRSYLYASSAIPDGKAKLSPSGLCEYNWDIPIVHKIVMAGAPRRVHSAIWSEHEIGIIANRSGAFERLEAFAAKLLDPEAEVPNREQLENELAEMRTVVAKTPATPYLLLEVGEIADMQGGSLVDTVDGVVKDIVAVGERVDRVIAGEEAEWLAELRKKPLDEMNFGYWSDVLYFSFAKGDESPSSDAASPGAEEVSEEQVVDEKPAKPAKAAKPAKPAKAAAKKPAKAAKKPKAAKAKKPAKKAAAKKPARAAKKVAKKPAKKPAKKKSKK